MEKSVRVPIEMREFIASLRKEGKTTAEITEAVAKKFNRQLSDSSIRRYKGAGADSGTSVDVCELMIELGKNEKSTAEIKKAVEEKFGIAVSDNTVRKYKKIGSDRMTRTTLTTMASLFILLIYNHFDCLDSMTPGIFADERKNKTSLGMSFCFTKLTTNSNV
jgi:intein-encoded DNA endonuclease-like protein